MAFDETGGHERRPPLPGQDVHTKSSLTRPSTAADWSPVPSPDPTSPDSESPLPAKAEKRKSSSAVREIAETLLLALVIFFAVRAVVLNFRVEGASMLPNLIDREMLLVNRNIYFHFDLNGALDRLPFIEREGERIIYPIHPPERGDIIVFNPPTITSQPYIKRVIGLAGDTITLENGGVFVNGEKLIEPYILGDITECPRVRCDPVTVLAGTVYVLGDNRTNSTDSRAFGPVPIDNIIGKAWITYWPIDEFGLVPHYEYPALTD
jgi:signal peptidase I